MNRKNLLSLIVLDAIVMILALGLLVFRYRSLCSLSGPAAPAAARQTVSAPAAPAGTRTPPPDSEEIMPAVETRNIGFTYRNSKARKVEIIGDFTEWVPKPMTKVPNHIWRVSLPLAPGDYAYNFVVNGKPIRDPNNARVCDVGRGFPNSYLKVKPLSHENEKVQ